MNEYSKDLFRFENTETGFRAFRAWMNDIAELISEGRYTVPDITSGLFEEIHVCSDMTLDRHKELTELKNRMTRWFITYFPEYVKVFANIYDSGSFAVLKEAPLPTDILRLDIDGILKIWSDAKISGPGIMQADALFKAAKHSIGSKRNLITARIKIRNLVKLYEINEKQLGDVMKLMDDLAA